MGVMFVPSVPRFLQLLLSLCRILQESCEGSMACLPVTHAPVKTSHGFCGTNLCSPKKHSCGIMTASMLLNASKLLFLLLQTYPDLFRLRWMSII